MPSRRVTSREREAPENERPADPAMRKNTDELEHLHPAAHAELAVTLVTSDSARLAAWRSLLQAHAGYCREDTSLDFV